MKYYSKSDGKVNSYIAKESDHGFSLYYFPSPFLGTPAAMMSLCNVDSSCGQELMEASGQEPVSNWGKLKYTAHKEVSSSNNRRSRFVKKSSLSSLQMRLSLVHKQTSIKLMTDLEPKDPAKPCV